MEFPLSLARQVVQLTNERLDKILSDLQLPNAASLMKTLDQQLNISCAATDEDRSLYIRPAQAPLL